MTLFMADLLRDLGRQVVIGCSGYGSPASEAARLAPPGELSAAEWGDEPAMVRWLRPDLPIIVGRRRVLAAQICNENFPQAMLLMDDGFQHLPIRKHVTIVLEDDGLKNRRCIPAGPYREPYSNRRHADLVLPGQFSMQSAVKGLMSPGGEARSTDHATYLCALARPDKFATSLSDVGIHLDQGLSLPDHDPLTQGNLFDALPAGLPIIVTAKDWVKLRQRTDLEGRNILIASYEIDVQPKQAFKDWLQSKLDGSRPGTPPRKAGH
jgi:tetraacyldisaccharide 4'-kinase